MNRKPHLCLRSGSNCMILHRFRFRRNTSYTYAVSDAAADGRSDIANGRSDMRGKYENNRDHRQAEKHYCTYFFLYSGNLHTGAGPDSEHKNKARRLGHHSSCLQHFRAEFFGGRRAPSDKRKALIIDVLQLPFSVFFTRLLNVYAAWIPVPEQLAVRIGVLVLAIVLIGVGAALTLDMRLVASPGDGIVQAISDRSGLELGLTKNIVDVCCVAFTCLLTLVCVRHIIGIGIGTLAGMLGTGRVIAIFNRMFGAYLIPLGKRD